MDREIERNRRMDLVLAWLQASGPIPDELLELRMDLRERIPAFHWMAEYPEVFFALNAERAQSESITNTSTSPKPRKTRKPRQPDSAQLDLKPKSE